MSIQYAGTTSSYHALRLGAPRVFIIRPYVAAATLYELRWIQDELEMIQEKMYAGPGFEFVDGRNRLCPRRFALFYLISRHI